MILEIGCFIFVIIISLLSTILYFRFCREGRMINNICGPKGHIITGNMSHLQLSPEILFKKLREWNKTFDGVWKMSGFNTRVLMLSKPEDIEVILSSSRFNDKSISYSFLYPWLNQGLLVSNGEKWHHRRKMLTPAFHFNILRIFLKTFNENTRDMLFNIEREVGKEKTDLSPLISKATLRIMCETSLGTKLQDNAFTINKYLKDIHTYGELVMKRISDPAYYFDCIYKMSTLAKKLNVKAQELQEFTRPLIENRRKYRTTDEVQESDHENMYGRKTKLAMLDLLLDEEKKGNIDDHGIQEEVDTFLFEGHDTTATALTFMTMSIANEPVIQDRIYEELLSIFGESQREPAIEDLSKMKYLECCIKESLRLYPSVPFVARFGTHEFTIAGYKVPRNTLIDIHIFDTHRDPDIYPEPEKFIPERFLPENTVKRHPYAYIPFSAGPRNCIGQKFAIMELKTVMSSLLRRFLLEPVTRPQDLVFSADLVLRTNHPIYVRICDRLNRTLSL